MKNTNIYKITVIVIFLNLLLHTALLHNIFTSGVICFDQDGNIKIENVEGCNDCSSHTSDFTFNENILNSNGNNCTDIILDINCYNDKQIIQKQKDINRQDALIALLTTGTLISSKFNFHSTFKKLSTNNFPLSSYLTVALLI